MLGKPVCLSGDVLLRREKFGALLCNLRTGLYYQYNEDGGDLLFTFSKGKVLPSKVFFEIEKDGYKVEKKCFYDFILRCCENSILEEKDGNRPLCFFFDVDRKEMRGDCLFRPTNVSLYLTHFCPKECSHCVTESSSKVDVEEELSVSDWEYVLNCLRREGVLSLVFTGGDPVLKSGFKDILILADELKFTFSLLTDYDGLNKDHLNFFKSLKYLNYIQVSLDGSNSKTHDFLRGSGSFEKSLKRLSLLRESGIRFAISSTIYKGNLREIDGIVSLYKKYKASILWLNPLAPFGRGKRLKNYVLDEKELKSLSFKYASLVKDGIINPGNDFWILSTEGKEISNNFNPLRNTPESASLGIYNLAINAYGECYLDSKMAAIKLLPLGNVLDRSICDIWNDVSINATRSLYSPNGFSFKSIKEIKKVSKKEHGLKF